MIRHSHRRIRQEAIYIVTNVIMSEELDRDCLRDVFQAKGFGIVDAFCKALEDKSLDTEVQLVILKSISTLLTLDDHLSDVHMNDSSVRFAVESVKGFDAIDQLREHQN